MTNTEIKKEILSAMKSKRIQNPQIELIIWHGDGTSEGMESINNSLEIEELEISIEFGTYEATEKDIKTLQAEQTKMYKYLEKHFENITKREENV